MMMMFSRVFVTNFTKIYFFSLNVRIGDASVVKGGHEDDSVMDDFLKNFNTLVLT